MLDFDNKSKFFNNFNRLLSSSNGIIFGPSEGALSGSLCVLSAWVKETTEHIKHLILYCLCKFYHLGMVVFARENALEINWLTTKLLVIGSK